MPYWISTILLLILAISLAVLEVFFPSAGVLAFLSAVALISSLVMAFYQGFWFGVVAMPTAITALVAAVVLGLKYWPKTAMGKRVLLTVPDSDAILPDEPERDFLHSLVGRTGRAKSKLLLSGVVTIDGRTFSAESEGMPVEEGELVRVIQVRGAYLVVRPIDEQSLPVDPLQQTYDDLFDVGKEANKEANGEERADKVDGKKGRREGAGGEREQGTGAIRFAVASSLPSDLWPVLISPTISGTKNKKYRSKSCRFSPRWSPARWKSRSFSAALSCC